MSFLQAAQIKVHELKFWIFPGWNHLSPQCCEASMACTWLYWELICVRPCSCERPVAG
jgi:hypothetical protein